MNEIKIPSIEFVRLKKGMTDSELNDYIAENDDDSLYFILDTNMILKKNGRIRRNVQRGMLAKIV